MGEVPEKILGGAQLSLRSSANFHNYAPIDGREWEAVMASEDGE